jgi:hypothetical protein
MNDDNRENAPDHDIIIELRTEVKGMRADLKSFSDDTKERLIRVEENKLDKQTFTDFLLDDKARDLDKERRIRFLERWSWAAWGVVGFIEFALILYVTFHR